MSGLLASRGVPKLTSVQTGLHTGRFLQVQAPGKTLELAGKGSLGDGPGVHIYSSSGSDFSAH